MQLKSARLAIGAYQCRPLSGGGRAAVSPSRSRGLAHTLVPRARMITQFGVAKGGAGRQLSSWSQVVVSQLEPFVAQRCHSFAHNAIAGRPVRAARPAAKTPVDERRAHTGAALSRPADPSGLACRGAHSGAEPAHRQAKRKRAALCDTGALAPLASAPVSSGGGPERQQGVSPGCARLVCAWQPPARSIRFRSRQDGRPPWRSWRIVLARLSAAGLAEKLRPRPVKGGATVRAPGPPPPPRVSSVCDTYAGGDGNWT
jgi:hypothetical protein